MKVYQIKRKEVWVDRYGRDSSIEILPEVYKTPPQLPENYSYTDSSGIPTYVEFKILEKELI